MAKRTAPILPDKHCEHCKKAFNRYVHPLTQRTIESVEKFTNRRFCSRQCSVAHTRQGMNERAKRINDQRLARKNQAPCDVDEPSDYRASASARALLKQVESLVKTVRTTRLRYINERIEIPRGWSLLDLIATSEKLELIPGYFDVVVWKQCEKGIPPVEEFQVAKRWNGLLLPDLGLS